MAFTAPIPGHEYCIDGTAEDGTFQGDGESPPFAVFDITAQKNVRQNFPTRAAALAWATERGFPILTD